MYKYRQTYRHADMQTYRYIEQQTHTHRQTDIHTCVSACMYTYRQADIQTYCDRHIQTYTDIYIHIHTEMHATINVVCYARFIRDRMNRFRNSIMVNDSCYNKWFQRKVLFAIGWSDSETASCIININIIQSSDNKCASFRGRYHFSEWPNSKGPELFFWGGISVKCLQAFIFYVVFWCKQIWTSSMYKQG
jgi:hypothetical protein